MERRRQGRRTRDAGVALVIALVLLLTLTVLVITSVRTATAELVMAGNEQYGSNASNAASAGVEQLLATFDGAREVRGSTGPAGADRFHATARYVAEETNLPGFSAEKMVGLHYEIESTGTSARNAVDVQVQGLMVLSVEGATRTFAREFTGLEQEAGP